MRRLQLVLLLAGVALFVLVVHRAGLAEILAGLVEIGWVIVPVLLVEMVIDFLHTEAWRRCLGPSAGAIPRLHLFLIRTGGYAVNILTPTATLGGEVVKGLLVKRWVPAVDAFASVILDKATFAVGQGVFLVLGLGAVFGNVPFTERQRFYAITAFALWSIGVGTFVVLLRRGALGGGLRAIQGLFSTSELARRLPERSRELDERIHTFLRSDHLDFALSVAWHVVAHVARILQFWLLLTALGFTPTLATCFTLAAGLVFMEATLFLVPARLGVQEGGHAMIFSALGFGATTGITISFAMRLSELAGALLGLAALAYYHFRPDELAGERT